MPKKIILEMISKIPYSPYLAHSGLSFLLKKNCMEAITALSAQSETKRNMQEFAVQDHWKQTRFTGRK